MVQSLNRGIHAGPSAKKVPRPQVDSTNSTVLHVSRFFIQRKVMQFALNLCPILSISFSIFTTACCNS